MMSCRNKRKAYRRKDVRERGSIFYVHTVVGGVVNCIEDIYGGAMWYDTSKVDSLIN